MGVGSYVLSTAIAVNMLKRQMLNTYMLVEQVHKLQLALRLIIAAKKQFEYEI